MTDGAVTDRMRDRVGALACLAVAVYAAITALPWGLRDPMTGEPGSGLYPLLTALGLGGLAAVLALRPGRRAPGGEAEAAEGPLRPFKLAGYVAALLAYAFLLEPLGYLIVTAGAMFFIMRVLEGIASARVLVLTAGALVGSWLLFERLLQVPLPRGPF